MLNSGSKTLKMEVEPMPKPWQNGEGYADPTAYEALKAVDRQEAEQQKKVNALVGVLKYIINAAGFDLLARIELKDRQTGREYK